MDENTPEEPQDAEEPRDGEAEPEAGSHHHHHHDHSHEAWPRRQVYFVTVEWVDDPHQPESPERIARIVQHALEHGHTVSADTPPARFVVRVKADEVAAEVEGKVEHHHHH